MAEQLFSKLDTKGQGYLEKSDLEAAFAQTSSGDSTSDSTSGAASVDEVFQALDSDSDGKLTQQEMSENLKKLSAAFDSQSNSMNMNGMGGGMSPPSPPPADGADSTDSAGFTKDELTSMISEASSSDDKRTSLMSSIVANFDEADTNSDGKVSNEEAMAFDKANQTSSSTSSSTSSASTSSTSSTEDDKTAGVMMRIMQLMASYGTFGDTSSSSKSGSAGSTLSVAA